MSSCVGCDLGAATTVWSRAGRRRGVVSIDAGGSMQSAVGVDGDGQLRVVGADPGGPSLSHETAGFVDALGGSEPIMVGATPYGPEALVSTVFSAVLAASADMADVLSDVFAIVHDDDLDPFRTSLLTEAARLAGIPTERVVLVTRSEARAAVSEQGGDDASGGALVALAGVPDDGDRDSGGAVLAAGAAGLAAGGAVGLGAHLADGGVAAAVAPAAGPAGVPLAAAGPSGATVGPTGTPLGSAGPGGTPLGSAGPAGTPLGSGGPAGTPLGSAGPGGTPLDTSGSPSAGGVAPKPRPRWLPAAAVGGAVAIVAVVGVVVLAQDDDDPPEAAAVATTAAGAAEPRATDEPAADPTTPATEPAPPTTEAGATEFDTSAFIGGWQQQCEPYLAGDGATTGRYAFEPAGPNQMEITISGISFVNVDCAGEGETAIANTATLTILEETVVEGRDAYLGDSDIGAFVIAVDGDTLYIGSGSAFDPELTATRR